MNLEIEYGKKGRPRLIVMATYGTFHFSFNTQSELDVWYHTIRSCLTSLSQRRHDAVWKRMSLVAKVNKVMRRKAYTCWMNVMLSKRGKQILSFSSDLCDGSVCIQTTYRHSISQCQSSLTK
jgi:hypothetical protein